MYTNSNNKLIVKITWQQLLSKILSNRTLLLDISAEGRVVWDKVQMKQMEDWHCKKKIVLILTISTKTLIKSTLQGAMLKIIELWLFRRQGQRHILRKHLEVLLRIINQEVARFRLQVASPNIIQPLKKYLLHKIELEHQLLQILVKERSRIPVMQVREQISGLRMLMEIFHPPMIRMETKNRSHHRRVLPSLRKNRKTEQSGTTLLVSSKS